MILATDMTTHFQEIGKIKAKLAAGGSYFVKVNLLKI